MKLLYLILLIFFITPIQSQSPHFIKQTSKHSTNDVTTPPLQYFEVSHSLPTDVITPSCTINLLTHSFANTYNTPPVTIPYIPPPATCQWTSAVLEFQAEVNGEQYDRIAGIWLAGVELLRTSTAQPDGNRIFWKVRKDVSRYKSVFIKNNVSLSVMLENIVNDEFTGVYHVNVTLYFYETNLISNAVNNAVSVPLSLSSDELEAKKVYRKLIFDESEDVGNAVSNAVQFPLSLFPDELEAKKVSRKLMSDEREEEGGAVSNAIRFPLSLSSDELEGNKVSRKFISVASEEGKAVSNSVVGDFDGIGSELGLYPYDKAADVIVPISVSNGVEEGFWFRIESEFDVKKKDVRIDQKTYKAVLELYVSFHGDDEFWYMNPSDEYVEINKLETGRAHGAYREVLVTIDGSLVGAVVPLPVIFTGGINPLFWEPVVGIGAFDLPSYDIDLTPFLGILLDGKSHEIGIQVADGISFWLADANLHIWLDHSNVKAGIVKSKVPAMEIERENEFVLLDGEFEIEGERESEVTSWVNSSTGNLKTVFSEKISFKNKIKYKDEGTKKDIDQYYKRKMKIKITNEMGKVIESLEVKIKHPLTIFTETKPGSDRDTSVMTTKVEQERNEKYYGDKVSRVLSHKQNCTGLMVVKGHNVLSGSADNHQNYNYEDEFGCYSRKVDVVSGDVVGDITSSNCNSLF